jgi:hypothetical protein
VPLWQIEAKPICILQSYGGTLCRLIATEPYIPEKSLPGLGD